jgi:hypothetical protein
VKTTGIFGGRFNPLDVIDEIEFSFKNLLIQEQEGAERLILGGGGNMSLDSHVCEKGSDFCLAHFVWMAFAVEKNEAANPIEVGLFRADAVMLNAQMLTHTIEQLWRRSRWYPKASVGLHPTRILANPG